MSYLMNWLVAHTVKEIIYKLETVSDIQEVRAFAKEFLKVGGKR